MCRVLLPLTITLLSIVPAMAYQPSFKLKAVGDIMMGTLYPVPLLPPDNGQAVFSYVRPFLTQGSPDMVLGNLEGALTTYGLSTKDVTTGLDWAFQMPPHMVRYLKESHFTVVSTANNHALDFGPRGYAETRSSLDRAGIRYTGGRDEILTMVYNGLKVAVIGFTWFDYSNNILNIPACMLIIKKAEETHDIVIAAVHGGGEGETALHIRPGMEYYSVNQRGDMMKFCRAAVDNGADIVIGHGPHVPRALEIYKDRLIAYSLGNFATYGMFETGNERKYSPILTVETASDGRFVSGHILSCIQFETGVLRGIPRYDIYGNAARTMAFLSSNDIPGNPAVISPDGRISVKH